MVTRCPHCKGMMRVDESLIPSGGGVRIRCPHCKGIDYVADPASAETRKVPANRSKIETVPSGTRTNRPMGGTPHAPIGSQSVSEATIPDDAFQGFRFPAEKGASAFPARRLSKRMRILLWVIASLVIVAIFALLVNIVLPGPGGSRPFGGALRSEHSRAAAFEESRNSVPDQDSHRSAVTR